MKKSTKKTPSTKNRSSVKKTSLVKLTPMKQPKVNATSQPSQPHRPAKKMSGLDAASKVLAETKSPMRVKDLIAAMADKGYWTSPGGKTPHATIYAAMVREITLRGKDARFVKTDRGLFAAKAEGKVAGKAGSKPLSKTGAKG